MAELIFDRDVESTPFDLDGELTEWRLVDTPPTAAEGERFPSRSFLSGGFRAQDDQNLFLGLQGFQVHLVMLGDWMALDGVGRVALAYRGHGGPTAGEFYAWGVELDVVGTTVFVFAVHQDQAGSFVSRSLGSFATSLDFIALAVSREIADVDQFESRSWLNGAPLATDTSTSTAPATPGQPVTLGMRLIAAETSERRFQGLIERVIIRGRPATDAEITHDYQSLRGAIDESADTVASYYNRQAFDTKVGGPYWKYRVRPGADLQVILDAGILRAGEALLPPGVFGPHLETYEGALAIRPSQVQSIAERQEVVRVSLASGDDLSPSALQVVAEGLFGVPPGDVVILEGKNYTEVPLTGTGELTGPPWRVRGPVDATNEAAGLTLHVPAGRDLKYQPDGIKSIFVELAISVLVILFHDVRDVGRDAYLRRPICCSQW